MEDEFKRYGFSKFRLLTGYLELLGAIGIIVGLYLIPFIYIFSTIGLSLLMALGIWTRFRVKDPWYQIIPAISLFILNVFLSYKAFDL